ncbi:hypothetical protein [Deinococcus hohokamensis]|uniref:Uncharacterized protein n=1 Tax=Deinococcus hohokamensis TaxID=309883 RepID=A0ABV9I8S4_9DEIO
MMRVFVVLAIVALVWFLWTRAQGRGRQPPRSSSGAQDTAAPPSSAAGRTSGVRVVPTPGRTGPGPVEAPVRTPPKVVEPKAEPRAGAAQPSQTPTVVPVASTPEPVKVAPVVAAPLAAAPIVAAPVVAAGTPLPPGTAALDDPDAVRPEVSAAALASARASVRPDVPDEVLSDALLDVTPTQLQQMFAAVPTHVMAQAIGRQDNVSQTPVKAQDLAQLQGLGDAVDELDIWSFGDDKA